MPFTLSHPAIILPLLTKKSKWFSASGLIAGSMIPDFEYFIRMKVQSIYSHTLPGLFIVDLPLAIVVCFAYHKIIRNSLLKNLPQFLKSRFVSFMSFQWTVQFKMHVPMVLLSIVIGAASHLLWDDFTHENGYFVLHSTYLQHHIKVGPSTVPVYKICQHASSLIGAIVIGVVVFQFRKQSSVHLRPNKLYWPFTLLITLTITITRFLFAKHLFNIGNLIVTIIGAVFITLVIAPFFMKEIEWSTPSTS